MTTELTSYMAPEDFKIAEHPKPMSELITTHYSVQEYLKLRELADAIICSNCALCQAAKADVLEFIDISTISVD